MFNPLIQIPKYCFLAILFLALSGCAGTLVLSKNSPVSSYKLTSAHVVWVENTSFPYNIYKTGRGYTPTIDSTEKADARKVIGQLLLLFRTSAASHIHEQLTINNVLKGDDVVLELTPVTANYNVGGGRGFDMRASIKQKDTSTEMWSVTIRAFGPPHEKDDVLLKNFVTTLVGELKKAGWLG